MTTQNSNPSRQLLGIVNNNPVYSTPSAPEKASEEFVGLVDSEKAYK